MSVPVIEVHSCPLWSVPVSSGPFLLVNAPEKNGIVSNFTVNVKDQSNLMKVGEIYLSISMSFL